MVVPLLGLLSGASPTDVGTGLVLDPTGELGPILKLFAPDRTAHLHADTLALDLMAGPRWSLDAELAERRWLSAAHRIVCRVVSLVPARPAGALDSGVRPDAERIDCEGRALVEALLAFVLMTTAPDAPPPATWLDRVPAGLRCMEALIERARGDGTLRGPNVVALTAWLLQSPLVAPQRSGAAFPSDWLLACVAAEARAAFAPTGGEARDLIDALTGYWPCVADVPRHYVDVRASARALCADLAAPPVARTLYFGCEPGLPAAAAFVPDLTRAVSPRIGGPLFVFQPTPGPLDLVALALKTLLFEAVLDDPDRALGHPGLPLVCYVADECQRFVTPHPVEGDPIHSEPGFLEASHTSGVCCLLTCPSLASLEHALIARGATVEQSRRSAILLWAGTGTKLVFRTTDRSTIERVAELCPLRPGLEPAVRVRPLSTLAVGECVALTWDGRFERRRLEPSPLVDALRSALPVPAPAPEASPESPGPGGAPLEVLALPGLSAPEPGRDVDS